MDPLNNNLNNNQNLNNQTPTPSDSLANKDEIPMSLEKKEEVNSTPTTQPVTSIFDQNLNASQPTTPTENKENEALLNFQTNSINPNQSIDINQFKIDSDEIKPVTETNLGNTINSEPTNVGTTAEPEAPITSQETTQIPSVSNDLPIEQTPSSTAPITTNNNQTIIIASVGVFLALGLVTGAYFLFFANNSSNSSSSINTGNVRTEKIMVEQNRDVKELSEEEYVAFIKSYIERYNNNVRSSRVSLATPNMTTEQRLEVYLSYSTEILNIYTEIQSQRVPIRFKDSHDKLTLSLYALNSLFDSLIKLAKDGGLTPQVETQLAESITRAEKTTADAFAEIANSQ